jgi:hypothetical protein
MTSIGRRHLRPKPKLLVIAGAGSSIDFGMPSVAGVHNVLANAAHSHFALAHNHDKDSLRLPSRADIRLLVSARCRSLRGRRPRSATDVGASALLRSTAPVALPPQAAAACPR